MSCRCVRDHNPNPLAFARHHIIPKSWGGSDDPSNLVTLCPTSHENLHRLLNAYVRAGGPPPWEVRGQFNSYVRGLVEHAWNARGPRTPYTLSSDD